MLDLNAKMSTGPGDEAAEDTGSSSSSSVVNAELDTSLPPPPAALIFDILKRDLPQPGFVTRSFFPEIGAGAGDSAAGPSRPQWLNLSFPDSSGAAGPEASQQQKQQIKKSRRGPRSRSSQYRGVTFYRRTGRWESHIWDCGKQVYLGGFDTAHAAARAYDRAAIKFRGVDADINFNVTDYDEDMGQMRNLNKEEFVQILRRQSTGFSRGSSKYRGVTLHKCGRWDSRMGQFLGKKAYDNAAINSNGTEAVTNFDHSSYQGQIILESKGPEVSGHNLDLNLGMSLPSDGPKPFQDARFNWNSSEIVQNRLRPVIEGTQVQPSHALSVATCSSGIYPNNFLQRQEERATTANQNQSNGVNSSQRFLNLPAWKINSGGSTNSTAFPVFSAAASSGFSSSISSSQAAQSAITEQTSFIHNIRFPGVSGAENSHSQVHRS